MKRYILLWICTGVILALIVTFTPYAFAQPYSNPDTTAIEAVRVFRHMLEVDDMLLIARYDVAYGNVTAQPTQPIDITFDFTYGNSTGSILGNETAYPFFNLGYARGIVAFYWAADDADIPVWNDLGNVTITGDAAYFNAPVPTDTCTLVAGDYSAYTSPADIREDLRQWMINQLLFIELDWNNWYADQGYESRQVDLLAEIPPEYIVLSATGEAYLSLAIDDFYDMCPKLFHLQLYDVSHTEGNWTLTQQQAYEAIHTTDYVGNATAAASDLMGGIGQIWLTTFVTLGIALGCVVVCQWKWGKANIGMLIGYTIMILSTPEGFMHMGIMALGSVLAVLVLVDTFFWKRSYG